MYYLHATWIVPEEEFDAFFAWKIKEAAMQSQAEGFVARHIYRDIKEPTHFVYIACWQTTKHAMTYGTSPEFRAASAAALATMPNTKITISNMREITPAGELVEDPA